MTMRVARFLYRSAEAWIWLTALILLALLDPGDHHHTLCPFSNLGISFCPGCGIGRSISLAFRGEWLNSLMMHPLGIPAIILLFWRSMSLIKHQIHILKNPKTYNYG